MSEREAYQEKVQAQLDIWQAEIDKMRAQAEKAQADGKVEFYRQIDQLQAQQKEAESRFRDMVTASDAAWRDFQTKTEAAWKDIAAGMQQAWDRYR